MEELADASGAAPRNSAAQEKIFSSDIKEKKSEAVEWTDEKHMLFLKSMEATFVNQLYKSLDLFGWHSHKSESKPVKHNRTNTCVPSGQFKVLHDGRWSTIGFTRDEREVNQEEEKPGVASGNQWIRHYRRSSERRGVRKSPASQPKAPLASISNQYSSHNFQLWHKDSGASNAEGTDQNFNDEDREEEKSVRPHESKRTKTSADATVISTDQVVPFNDIARADNVTEGRTPADQD